MKILKFNVLIYCKEWHLVSYSFEIMINEKKGI